MPCTRPLDGWRSIDGEGLTFDAKKAYRDQPVQVPCGQCLDCRLRRKRDWAIRIMHEASLHDENSFLTLTYDDENLPEDGSLRVRDWQLFAKRLRKRIGSFRFFHCGEYGERFGRPHYHAILFGHDFSGTREVAKQEDGFTYYVSEVLGEVWNKGLHILGEVDFDSAAYVAGYCVKKVTGKKAEEHYERSDQRTGEIWSVRPEYATMSRRPGIGTQWFDRFKEDVYSEDFVVSKGRKFRPPKFYDKKLEEEDERRYQRIAAERRSRFAGTVSGVSPRDREDRSRNRELVLASQLALRSRKL